MLLLFDYFLLLLLDSLAVFTPVFWQVSCVSDIKLMPLWASDSTKTFIIYITENLTFLLHCLLQTFLMEILAFQTPRILAYCVRKTNSLQLLQSIQSNRKLMAVCTSEFQAVISSSSTGDGGR